MRTAPCLVVMAHPDLAHSRVTRRVQQAFEAEPQLVLHDLYARYPDFWIDVDAERAALSAAQLVVWLHPVHWYGMPALMKQWMDTVLGYGWAYGPGGTALAGKDLWLCASAGGAEDSYRAMLGAPSDDHPNVHPFDPFLPPYRQTAALTRMRWLPPSVFFHAHRAEGTALDAHVADLVARLRRYPEGLDDTPWALPAEVAGERPLEGGV